MSSGHEQWHNSDRSERTKLLRQVLRDPKVKRWLSRPYTVITTTDVPLLGSSSIGWERIYIDRHLRAPWRPVGTIIVDEQPCNTIGGLIRHERLEPCLEQVFGWSYKSAHLLAECWEDEYYRERHFNPRAVEQAFKPYIKAARHEALQKVATDIDLRPEMAPPRSSGLLERIKKIQNRAKDAHSVVGYRARSAHEKQQCGLCRKFIREKFGGPGCIGVKDTISPLGWCRRFAAGKLEEQKNVAA